MKSRGLKGLGEPFQAFCLWSFAAVWLNINQLLLVHKLATFILKHLSFQFSFIFGKFKAIFCVK